MFKLVVMATLAVIGQSAGSTATYENNKSFVTEQECKAYPKSEAGAADYNALVNFLSKSIPDGSTLTMELSCRRDEGEPI